MPDFTPRPTVYNGIQMRSRLEAGFAAWLDKMRVEWAYEPKAFGGSEGQYLPDFYVPQLCLIGQNEPRSAPAYIEVKPVLPYDDQARLARRMAVIWKSEPEAHLIVVVRDHMDDGLGVSAIFGDDPDVPVLYGGFAFLIQPYGLPLCVGAPWPSSFSPWVDGFWEVK